LTSDPGLSAQPTGESLNDSASQSEHQSVLANAMVSAFGTLLSRILGLLRDMMTARYFSNDVRDAFLAAFRLPNLFRRLLGEGALSIAFIPVFVEVLSGRGEHGKTHAEKRARRLVSGVFSILLTFVITISILSTIFMEDILRVLLSGDAYMSVPGKFELTVHLARIMFGLLILVSAYSYFMAILNGLRQFALTAIAPCFFNLAMIAVARLSPRLAAPESALAWAVILGGCLQLGILIPGVWRAGFLPRPTFRWGSNDIARVVWAMLPGIFGMSILQLTSVVNMYFASHLPSGSQSYLYLADRLLELPLSLFVVSVGAALLPTLSKLHHDGNRAAMSETVNHSIRLILFIALPASVGLFVLAHPIVEVLFLGREFKYADALATAQLVQVYSLGVIVLAGTRILAQGFYAIQNTWYPAVAGLVSLISHILFAAALTRSFGLAGLAAATVASAGVNLIMLALAYNSWVGALRLRDLAKNLAKFAFCAAVMVGALQIYGIIMHQLVGRFFTRSAVLFVTIAIGLIAYMAVARVLRLREYTETVNLMGFKIGKFRED
jgi:putative peptidoglycan lipid II flippase